ncbi:HalOD1 output domain-containing protein [Halopiger goleimassiliensis]|uniref:HalOD1 output domain-containing protein n=1 Tax=Halopiger goleimassiliensis TaxID=1293048 RepID=UPI00067801DE|nr:HalOD1 output domain-containing protein [Halopiger goleimassiliensis]
MPSEDDHLDPAEDEYVTTFDPDAGESASESVITAVAALSGTRPVDLPPLYEAVDPDALDSLIAHARRTDAGTHELWFSYDGFDVSVRSDGRIRIVGSETPSAGASA